MDLNKRLLALSWVMPPIVLPRSIQISRTLAALKRRGWTSHVVTSDPEATPDSPKDHVLSAYYDQAYAATRLTPQPPRPSFFRRAAPPGDALSHWRPQALAACIAELDRWRPDAFVTFAQPWIDHEIGLEVNARRPGTPWIAHFSDPWVDSPYYAHTPPDPPGTMERWRKAERSVVERADALVFVTAETRDLVMAKYRERFRAKTFVTPHADDRGFLASLGFAPAANPRLRFTYTGNMYAGMREPTLFLEALARLHAEAPLTDFIEVEMVGAAPDTVVQAAQALPISSAIHFKGRVKYVDSLRAAAEADILLLLDAPGAQSVFLPSKIVDYLMMDKPILGLTPLDGASARVLRAGGHPVVAPDDVDAIVMALRPFVDAARAGVKPTAPSSAGSTTFDSDVVTASFEQALLYAIDERRRA